MIACFPFTMLLASPAESIDVPLVILGLVQFPIYGALVGWASARSQTVRMSLALAVIHVGFAMIALLVNRNAGRFWP